MKINQEKIFSWKKREQTYWEKKWTKSEGTAEVAFTGVPEKREDGYPPQKCD